jgi:4-amino-4-deoxy-L-arabinose transferase-like glycosyltransferase
MNAFSNAMRLVMAIVGVAVVWLVVLPWLLACGPVARHVTRMEDRGVNPAAMYYTELERLPLRPEWLERRITLWP